MSDFRVIPQQRTLRAETFLCPLLLFVVCILFCLRRRLSGVSSQLLFRRRVRFKVRTQQGDVFRRGMQRQWRRQAFPFRRRSAVVCAVPVVVVVVVVVVVALVVWFVDVYASVGAGSVRL